MNKLLNMGKHYCFNKDLLFGSLLYSIAGAKVLVFGSIAHTEFAIFATFILLISLLYFRCVLQRDDPSLK